MPLIATYSPIIAAIKGIGAFNLLRSTETAHSSLIALLQLCYAIFRYGIILVLKKTD